MTKTEKKRWAIYFERTAALKAAVVNTISENPDRAEPPDLSLTKSYGNVSHELKIAPHISRAFTVETADIVNAYVNKDEYDKEQIRIYGMMDQIAVVAAGGAYFNPDTGEVRVHGMPEPRDDAKTFTGRRYDYGRF